MRPGQARRLAGDNAIVYAAEQPHSPIPALIPTQNCCQHGTQLSRRSAYMQPVEHALTSPCVLPPPTEGTYSLATKAYLAEGRDGEAAPGLLHSRQVLRKSRIAYV